MKFLKVLLILALLLSAAIAGDDHEEGDGDGPSSEDNYDEQEHDCQFDPCSLPAPPGCVYDSCEVREHSCAPIYYDDEDNEVCQRNRTEDACPAYGCDMYCPYGFKRDDNGCPMCECNERRSCNQACTRVECADNERPVILPGDCCPTCVPSCDNVYCTQVACADNQIAFFSPNDCCPTCVNATDCSLVDCPQEVDCEENEMEVQAGCCSVCMPRVDCEDVECPPIECAEGQHKRMRDEHCCPVCVDTLDCHKDAANATACPGLNCAEGEALVQGEDDCCPRCVSENACNSVLCPAFTGDCPDDDDYHVKKNGTCCSYCPGTVCRDTVTTRCDSFDRPVCAPGWYRGDNCTEPVPESERVSIQVEITVNGLSLTAEDIKFFIANKLNIDAMYIGVDMTANNTFVITISWAVDAPPAGMDQAAIEQAVSQAIATNPNFVTATKKESTSAAAHVAAGSVLLLAALAM